MKALSALVPLLATVFATPGVGLTQDLAWQEDHALVWQPVETPTSPVPLVTPAERVAAAVREALREPQSHEIWACLDLALSEMNAPVEEGLEFVSQAERVASSQPCPGATVHKTASSSTSIQTRPGGPQRAAISLELLSGAWQRVNRITIDWESLAADEPWIVPGLILLACAALFWIGRRSVRPSLIDPARQRGREHRSSPRTSHRRDRAPKASKHPRTLALDLWEGGLPSPEIARRTGLAQDAVSVLLAVQSLEGTAPEGGWQPESTPNGYARTGGGRR